MMSINAPKTLPEAIRALRESTGLTYAQMGVRCDLDPSTIWKAEQGKRVQRETAVKLARGFKQDVSQWLAMAGFDDDLPEVELARGLKALSEEFDRAIPVDLRKAGTNWTREEVEGFLARTRHLLEEGKI